MIDGVLGWQKTCDPRELVHKQEVTVRILDLCAGVGGGSLGVAASVFDTHGGAVGCSVHLVDKWEKALAVSRLNWDVRTTCADVAEWQVDGQYDVVVAGPPCQGHSTLNNRTRGNDPRNALYLEVTRKAVETEAELILIENVPGVVHSEGREVDKARTLLESEGYHVRLERMRAWEYGVSQKRIRWFLVARKSAPPEPKTPGLAPSVGIALTGLSLGSGVMDTPPRLSEKNRERMDWLYADSTRMRLTPASGLLPPSLAKKWTHTDAYGRMDPSDYAPTITGNCGTLGSGRFGHPTQKRLITLREAARVQGFPDAWSFGTEKATHIRTMLGNAIPPALTYAWYKS